MEKFVGAASEVDEVNLEFELTPAILSDAEGWLFDYYTPFCKLNVVGTAQVLFAYLASLGRQKIHGGDMWPERRREHPVQLWCLN